MTTQWQDHEGYCRSMGWEPYGFREMDVFGRPWEGTMSYEVFTDYPERPWVEGQLLSHKHLGYGNVIESDGYLVTIRPESHPTSLRIGTQAALSKEGWSMVLPTELAEDL